MLDRLRNIPWWAGAILSGVLIAGSLPPWGWWPMIFLGFALWDDLTADVGAFARFRRSFVVAATWLTIAMFWMIDLTLPGFILAVLAYSFYFGLAGAITPTKRSHRFIVFPAAMARTALVTWSEYSGTPESSSIPMSSVIVTPSNPRSSRKISCQREENVAGSSSIAENRK